MARLVLLAGLLGVVGAQSPENCWSFFFFRFCNDRQGQASDNEPQYRQRIKLTPPPSIKSFRFDVDELKKLARANKLNTGENDITAVLPDDNYINHGTTATLNNKLFEAPQCVGEAANSNTCPTSSTHIPPQGFGDSTGSCYAVSSCTEAELKQYPCCAGGKHFDNLCEVRKAGFAGCDHLVTKAVDSTCPKVDPAALSVAAIDVDNSNKQANSSIVELLSGLTTSIIKYINWDRIPPIVLFERECRHEYRRYATTGDEHGNPNPKQRFEFVGSSTTTGAQPKCDVDPTNICTSGYVMRRCHPACTNLGAAATEMKGSSVQAYKFFSSSMYKQWVRTNLEPPNNLGKQIVVSEWTNEDAGICGEAEHMRGFGGASADPNLAWTNWWVYSTSGGTLRNGRMLVHAFPHTLSFDSGVNLKTELQREVRAAMNAASPDEVTSNSVSVTINSFNALTIKTTSKMEFPWYTFLPDTTIYLTVKVRLYHHGKKLQVVVTYTHWRWSAGGLGLPNFVADDVSDGARDTLDLLKVELAEGILATLKDALGGDDIMDASFATFAFFDQEGTVASLLNL